MPLRPNEAWADRIITTSASRAAHPDWRVALTFLFWGRTKKCRFSQRGLSLVVQAEATHTAATGPALVWGGQDHVGWPSPLGLNTHTHTHTHAQENSSHAVFVPIITLRLRMQFSIHSIIVGSPDRLIKDWLILINCFSLSFTIKMCQEDLI